MPPAAAQQAILAAEDSRLALPDDLHTPAIETFRAKQDQCIKVVIKPGEKFSHSDAHVGHAHSEHVH